MLTPLGEEQCLALKDKLFRNQSQISLVVASPLSRALHSAFLIFQPYLGSETSSHAILALPDAQETSDDPCDVGSDVKVLKSICRENSWPVDLSLVKEGWNDKRIGGPYSPASSAIASRAREARIFLREQAQGLIAAGNQDVHIVLVAYGGFMHYFSEDWENSAGFPGTGWVNCETRAYAFEYDINNDKDVDAHVVETMESRHRRGLDQPMISKDKQGELFVRTMQAWEDQGLQNPMKIGLVDEEVEDCNRVDDRGIKTEDVAVRA